MDVKLEKQKVVEDRGFHLKLAAYFMKRALPFCKGRILDLGCGVGVITKALVDAGFEVVGVDGNKNKIETAKKNVPEAKFVVALFQNFEPEEQFNTIIAKNVFEHFSSDETRELAKKVYSWLHLGGRVVVNVPNALSLNRRIGYHMGISKHYSELTERDVAVGHVQLYTRDRLELELNEAGFRIIELKGLMLKPFPNVMMECLDDKICDALFEVANDSRFADLCGSIMVVGEKSG